LDSEKEKKIKAFIEYLNAAGEIIELLKSELDRVNQIEGRENLGKEIVQRYMRIEKHSENLRFYEDQIRSMLDFASEYEFYDDRKRNMALKELEADLQTIERTFEILKQRHKFFNQYILSKRN
jgi:hypothetical protein